MLGVRPLAMGIANSRLNAQPAPEVLAGLAAHAASSPLRWPALFALRPRRSRGSRAGQLAGPGSFLTILMTVGIPGLTAAPLAKLLRPGCGPPSETKVDGERDPAKNSLGLRWRGCAQRRERIFAAWVQVRQPGGDQNPGHAGPAKQCRPRRLSSTTPFLDASPTGGYRPTSSRRVAVGQGLNR